LTAMTIAEDLIHLSHEIGREDRGLAVLSEGNTSALLSDDSYLVKASGTGLGTLRKDEVVECRLSSVLSMLDKPAMSDEEIEAALLASRANGNGKKPSVEAVFHAWALSLPGIRFVGHCHPVYVNQILCSPRARDFAAHRMFADEIVCSGVASVFVPLTDPGLKLAHAIRTETTAYMEKYGCLPKVILMENHGIIAIGPTATSVLATLLMTEKAAHIFVGAALLGGPNFLSDEVVSRIATRPDELYRQRLLDKRPSAGGEDKCAASSSSMSARRSPS
jgi:rhamnose utilization protein RhaD (predicted bifunctional aldolase and dehydrogenase)